MTFPRRQSGKTADELAIRKASTDGLGFLRRSQGAALMMLLLGPIVATMAENAPPAGANGPSNSTQLEEVLVTAQKMTERLQDVPVPVSVINASSLVESNITRLTDYFSQVPGLSDNESDGFGTLAIRGISPGESNATVGVTLDGVPVQMATALAGSGFLPEIDPTDLKSIEVLRGPQGTLYGGNTMGGLINYITIDPSTSELSGRAQIGVSGIHNGTGAGYNASGAINVPLNTTMAVRISAFTHQDPGYIDNPVLDLDGLNKSRTSGGRLSGLWTPSDDFSLKLSGLYQQMQQDGSNLVEIAPGFGNLQQNFIRDSGHATFELGVYSATLHAKLGITDVTSITGYMARTVQSTTDDQGSVPLLDPLSQQVYGTAPGSIGALGTENARFTKLSQELRLHVPFNQTFDWLLGLFYSHETSPQNEAVYAAYPATGHVIGLLWAYPDTSPFTESAVFTDLTVHFTDHFDIQIGGRESRIRDTYNETDSGPYAEFFEGGSPYVYPVSRSSADAFTYLFTPRYRFSDDLMAYIRLASGFRPGGPNPGYQAFGFAPKYDPDKTYDYELGVKGETLEHRLSFDTSLYYIDWKNTQLPGVYDGFYPYIENGSGAKSEGIELSTQFKPMSGLTLSGWVAYNNAVLTQALPPSDQDYGARGDRLPQASRVSGNLSADYDFPLSGQITGFAGATETYTGNSLGTFNPAVTPGVPPPRQVYGGYATTALRSGIKFDRWTAQLYATNLLNRFAIIAGGIGSGTPNQFTIITPRTVGLNMFTTF